MTGADRKYLRPATVHAQPNPEEYVAGVSTLVGRVAVVCRRTPIAPPGGMAKGGTACTVASARHDGTLYTADRTQRVRQDTRQGGGVDALVEDEQGSPRARTGR